MSCRLGDPDALLWSTTSQSGEAAVPTVLAHSGAESDKCCVVECMDWQSAGTMLATGSMDGWVRVWNKSGTASAATVAAQYTRAPVLGTNPSSIAACYLGSMLLSRM